MSCHNSVVEYIKNIKLKQDLNAFIEVFEKEAEKKAIQLDKSSNNRALSGLVIGVKDNICIKDHFVSAGSKMLHNFRSTYNATAIQKIIDQDAIIIGRLNCDEFGMGNANIYSNYGKTLNPIDKSKTPGGSSGGSAAAVAADLCDIALGTDTGGSVRQPASFCGVFGYKPSYGTVSRHGLIAYASSFDQIGILSKSLEHIISTIKVISGRDDYDSSCYQKHLDFDKKLPNKPKKIAYFSNIIQEGILQKEIQDRLKEKITSLEKEGHILEPIDFEYLKYLIPIYYIISTAEASSNLSRYSGIHYGYRSDKTKNIEDLYKMSRTEGFGDEVKRRVMLGTFVLKSDYNQAYYKKAQKARRLIYNAHKQIFRDYDFILTPTTPHTAFDLDKKRDPVSLYLEDILTVYANITGCPAISIPCGVDNKNLPIGLQIMANNFEDNKLLRFSKYF